MLIFVCITAAGFILLLGGSIFGHDHDADHDHGGHFDHGHDAGHGEATVSVFSTKVIGAFLMGFGAGGAIAAFYGANPLMASLIGLAVGFLIGLLMYGVMRLIYGQQSTSIVTTDTAVGEIGAVTVPIGRNGTGEVAITLRGQHRSFLARSADTNAIPKGRQVRVVHTTGSQLVVREVEEANAPLGT
ncbi:MAG TPA: NfeD family protein [Thermoanaerobaculia bacterium]|nr:NfeD family protein [Thermoanaerobaculia bacterium]